MSINRSQEINLFKNLVVEAEDLKSIDKIKESMKSEKFGELSQDEKEQFIFKELMMFYPLLKISEDILYYLIFDYKISADNSINIVENSTLDLTKAQEMFKVRTEREDFHSKLVDELADHGNDSKTNKKLKV